MSKMSVSIFWFRRDLRLEDNHGLYQALQGPYPVLPIFIFDKHILEDLADKSDRRVDFIHQALKQIDASLKLVGSNLHIIHETPSNAFNQLIQTYDIRALYANKDYEPYARSRDQEIEKQLAHVQATSHWFKDQVLFEAGQILKENKLPYTIYTPFSKQWKSKFTPTQLTGYPSEKSLDNLLKSPAKPFISIESIGFQKTDFTYTTPQIPTDIIQKYDQTRNIPAIKGTSAMSVHLRFGTISIRKAAKVAFESNEQWLNELIWREFFMTILFHFPQVVNNSFKSKYDKIQWRNHEAEFKRWCEGKTGYPIVDAGMRELNATGLMHNRVRMIVASFLTKHLLIDWRWGEAYFASKLLDYDLSANNGNWQWAAGCGCDAAPYFRIFNPAEQTKKFDPQGLYIRKWVPELNELNYPTPMIEHKFARERVLREYKEALGNEA